MLIKPITPRDIADFPGRVLGFDMTGKDVFVFVESDHSPEPPSPQRQAQLESWLADDQRHRFAYYFTKLAKEAARIQAADNSEKGE
jgi:hypothetical protein